MTRTTQLTCALESVQGGGGTGSSVLPEAVHEISPDLEGIGTVRAFYVDVADRVTR